MMKMLLVVFFGLIFCSVLIESQWNEYNQYKKYMQALSHFNGSAFFTGARDCQIGRAKITVCTDYLYDQLEQQHPISKAPVWKSENRRTRNCKYEVIQIKTTSRAIFLHLQIFQHDCTDKEFNSKFPGGSSFYVLAEGLYQQMCEVHDLFNNYYDVLCFHQPLFLYDKNLLLSANNFHSYPLEKYHQADTLQKLQFCQFVTILLDYEHFDAYAEPAAFPGDHYPWLQTYILDRIEYCADPVTGNTHSHRRKLKISLEDPPAIEFPIHHDPGRGEWVAGLFRAQEKYHAITNGVWALNQTPSDPDQFRRLTKDPANYQWIWQIDLPAQDNQQAEHFAQLRQLPCLRNIFSLLPHPERLPPKESEKLFDATDSVLSRGDYYFLGESHLRYTWDYLIEEVDSSLFEIGGVLQDRYHTRGDFQNFHFMNLLYTIQQANYYQDYCSSRNHPDPWSTQKDYQIQKNYFVILQTGSWHLSYFPVMEVIESPFAGPLLLKTLRSFYGKDASARSCFQQTEDFEVLSYPITVYLDMPPYPYCQSNIRKREVDVGGCYEARLARNNYVIAAMNQFFDESLFALNQELSSSSSSSSSKGRRGLEHIYLMRSSRDVLLPRVMSVQYLCKNHYLCRETRFNPLEGSLVAQASLRLLCALQQIRSQG